MSRRSFEPPCGFDIANSTVPPDALGSIAYWGYRLVRHPSGTVFLHEVYYDDREGILGVALAPARPCGDTAEEVREGWEAMEEAFGEGALSYDAFTSPATTYGRYADAPFETGDDEAAGR